jgi:hypothetical protein
MTAVDVKAGHTQIRQGGKGITYGLQAPLLRTKPKRAALPSGDNASTFFAHIAFDEHAKIRRRRGRHTALVKNSAVLRGREVRLRL